MRNENSSKVRDAENIIEFNFILLELFAELKNSHSNVYTGMSSYGLPVLCDLIEDQVIITYVGDNQILDKGIGKGWIVKKISQQPAKKWLKNRFKIISGSTEQALWKGSLFWVFRRYQSEPEVREYSLIGPQGDILNISLSLDLPSDQFKSDRFSPVETRDLGEYGYIANNTMQDGIVELFDQSLKNMISKNGLILDLRRNSGGNSVNGEKIIQRLIQKKTRIWQNKSLNPYNNLNYKGRIVVLIGPHTFSAAESFAFNLHDSGRVITIGEPTCGDSGGGPVMFRTKGGIYFRLPTRDIDYSASGLPMEGRGLKPHIHVTQTYEDLLQGRDTVLEVALKKVKQETP